MDNDRIFTIYAVGLIAAVASVITASLMAGLATLPSPLLFAQEYGLALLIRGASKSFADFDGV